MMKDLCEVCYNSSRALAMQKLLVLVDYNVPGIGGRPDECFYVGAHERLLQALTPLFAALTPTYLYRISFGKHPLIL